MTGRIAGAMALLSAVVALLLALPLALIAGRAVQETFVHGLDNATLACAVLLSAQPEQGWPRATQLCAERTGTRVIVVDPQRRLISDSDASPLGRQFDRPEIERAFTGVLASDARPSLTVGGDLRYAAAPVLRGSEIVAVVRTSLPDARVAQLVRQTLLWLAVAVAAVTLTAALLGLLLAATITRPLARLSSQAALLAGPNVPLLAEDDGPGEVRSLARVLNSMVGRLRGHITRADRVAAEASHHLRSPLTGVRLRLEAIGDMTDNPAIGIEVAAATLEVDRLNHRIEQLLALARSDAQRTGHDEVDLGAIVEARCQAATVVAQERGLVIEVSAAEALFVRFSESMLNRLIDELLANALAYARTTVRVQAATHADSVVLSVEDDGPGVAAVEQTGIFERFMRGSTAHPGGSGLGLALVRETVRAAGGDAEAGRAPAGGLQVRVHLPLLAAVDQTATGSPASVR